MEKNLIKKTSARLIAHEEEGAFRCYPALMPATSSAVSDWPYEIHGDELKIFHRNIVVSVQGSGKTIQFCEDGGDFFNLYRREH